MRSDNRGRDIFYGIVAIATLIVAIIGATLAYFSVTANSNVGAVNATAAVVSIEYEDGSQVTAQADELIPSTLDVVKTVYAATVGQMEIGSSPTVNACIDSNDRQVCSVYRFTVESDDEREITAMLNNEYNGFTYLSYAVRDVTNNNWIDLSNDGSTDLPLTPCRNNTGKEEEACYIEKGPLKIYSETPKATNSIFGYTVSGGKATPKSMTVVGGVRTFDLVLFIKENELNQNIDQGQTYSGTIVIDVIDSDIDGDKITGCVGDDC